MALPENFLYQLKQNNPIESVISSYLKVIRRGRNNICLCPFHSEKTPSFTIFSDTQSFYCFGCGAGGDVITFIMKMENLEYFEAVKFLAEKCGMTLPEDAFDKDISAVKSRTLEINRAAAKFYYNILTKEKCGEKGRRYFSQRMIQPNTINKYGLGYAPDDWYMLSRSLKQQGYSEEELITANLCGRGKNGGLYDLFRDRVMFPIIDLRGNVIAFGGRVIDSEGPKYINSSDTPVFKKSRNLFSLNFAKKDDKKQLILAEGYMDVISINQAGFENVIATLGTALTQEQARLMSQYADEVIIAYDSDGAGQAATHKAINLLSEVGVNTRIIKMDGAKDPDEYIKKFGVMRFKQLLDNSDGAINFELQKCRDGLDIDSDTGKVEYLKRCVNVLADISSPIEREVYISKIAADQKISKDTLIQQVQGIIRKRKSGNIKKEWNEIRLITGRSNYNTDKNENSKIYKAESGIIYFLVNNPNELEYIKNHITFESFTNEFNRKIFKKVVEEMDKSPDYDIMSIQSELTAEEMGKLIKILTINKQININRSVVDDYINILLEGTEKSNTNIKELSDDDFLKYTESLKYRK